MSTEENIRKLVKDNGISHWETSNSYVFTCPRCNKSDKLWMYKTSGYFKCWVCAENSNYRGKPEYAFCDLLNQPITLIRQAIYGATDGPLQRLTIELKDHWGDRDEDAEEVFWVEQQRTSFEWPPDYVDWQDPCFKKALEYLESRGLTIETVKKYDIRFAVPENRVVFPYVLNGVLVGWQGRWCGKAEVVDLDTGEIRSIPKALTTAQDDVIKNNVMFSSNLDVVDHCVLAEGPLDALKCELAGGNVAALGKGVSDSQIEWIGARVSKLYLALDLDAAAEMARIKKIAYKIGLEVYLMTPPNHREDFGDCTFEEAYESFKSAQKIRAGHLLVSLGKRMVY